MKQAFGSTLLASGRTKDSDGNAIDPHTIYDIDQNGTVRPCGPRPKRKKS